ncbi:hypothetical protein QQ054_00650 [Oscillatoria amoena NRMC-F 0135]|nr:hypothetical protein [Oscillatoria amoena NRMC-F 0135]
MDRDSIGLSPFVGVSHGWGKWNLAGTVAYSYAAEYFDAQPYRPGFTIENHNLLTTVRASYAIDEKWTLGGKVANTWLMHREDLPGLMFGGGPGAAVQRFNRNDNYTTLGLQVNFKPCSNWDTYVGVESNVGRSNYWDIFAKIGASYSF